MIKSALESGKHVLVEKPISATIEEADEVIAIAAENTLKFTV